MADDQRTIPGFLDALASDAPAPGGGAAAALAGALAAACAEMVARFTAGRPKFAAVGQTVRDAIADLVAARAALLALVEADAAAFATVSAAYRLPRLSEEEHAAREAAIQAALHTAMEPPLAVMRQTCDVLTIAETLAGVGNPTVASDAACAALLGEGAVRAAAVNVLANVALLRDEAAAGEARQAITQLEERAGALRERTMAAFHARLKG
ncbi:MAG TPA: cyclodeaminase/cyclohydrolase family protein [Ktedonobacterales bacterium]|nr:cyclodeaminase/cyclohydrolase family protein [Ktedonobacterales bacterium]